MFLCSIDGKIYSDDAVSHSIILKYDIISGDNKEIDIKICCLCYGLMNCKYKLNNDGKYIVPITEKIKIYKISSNTFNYKSKELTVDDNKCLIDTVIKTLKQSKKKSKK